MGTHKIHLSDREINTIRTVIVATFLCIKATTGIPVTTQVYSLNQLFRQMISLPCKNSRYLQRGTRERKPAPQMERESRRRQ